MRIEYVEKAEDSQIFVPDAFAGAVGKPVRLHVHGNTYEYDKPDATLVSVEVAEDGKTAKLVFEATPASLGSISWSVIHPPTEAEENAKKRKRKRTAR